MRGWRIVRRSAFFRGCGLAVPRRKGAARWKMEIGGGGWRLLRESSHPRALERNGMINGQEANHRLVKKDKPRPAIAVAACANPRVTCATGRGAGVSAAWRTLRGKRRTAKFVWCVCFTKKWGADGSRCGTLAVYAQTRQSGRRETKGGYLSDTFSTKSRRETWLPSGRADRYLSGPVVPTPACGHRKPVAREIEPGEELGLLLVLDGLGRAGNPLLDGVGDGRNRGDGDLLFAGRGGNLALLADLLA